MSDSFTFTIADVGRFLGKAPVTLRAWERRGLVALPRDPSGDRRASLEDLRDIGRVARDAGRITTHRLNLIEAATTLLDLIEKENQ